jgi:chaperonin cofactor prefoldin
MVVRQGLLVVALAIGAVYFQKKSEAADEYLRKRLEQAEAKIELCNQLVIQQGADREERFVKAMEAINDRLRNPKR